jgi:hypothetical protein
MKFGFIIVKVKKLNVINKIIKVITNYNFILSSQFNKCHKERCYHHAHEGTSIAPK